MGLLQPHGRGRRLFRPLELNLPAIVIHSLAHAVAALEAAAALDCEIALVSAPEAGIYAGVGWFRAMIEAARAEVPAARCSAWLDCGDDAGAALAALRGGIGGVIFSGGRRDVAQRLADIAGQSGAVLATERPPAVLDLAAEFFAQPAALRQHCAEAIASPPPIC